MFTGFLDLPPDGWLSYGDPGPCPPLPDEPDCGCQCCGSCLAGTASSTGTATCTDSATSADSAAPAAGGPLAGAGGWAVPGVSLPPAGPCPLLASLTAAVDGLAEHGPLSGSRTDTSALLQLAERARALAVRELAEMDATGGPQQPGSRPTTAAAWLRDSQHLTDGAARSQVRLARDLREDLPEVAGLLAAGQITLEHAAAVAGGVRGLDRDLIREAGAGLAALSLVTDPLDLRRRLRDKAHAVDDRLGADADRRARDRQHLRLTQVGAHTAIDGTLAAEDGATVRLAMALAVEAARTDGDTRSPGARQADIFVQWAADYLQRHSAGDSLAGDAHTIRTHLLTTCTADQLAAPTDTGRPAWPSPQQDRDQGDREVDIEDAATSSLPELLERDLAGAPPISPTIIGTISPLSRAALRRLACDATISLAVLRTPGQDTCPARCPVLSGRLCEHLSQPLYVGRSARTVSGQQFKALVVRDRTCVVRGCHRPPAQCAAHHVRHWADGGASDLDNLVLLCHQHHHDHHDRGHDLPHHDGQRRLTATGWGRAPT